MLLPGKSSRAPTFALLKLDSRFGNASREMISGGDSEISLGLIRRNQVYEVEDGQLYIAAVKSAPTSSIAVQVRQSDRFQPVLSGATSKATAGHRTESCKPIGVPFVQDGAASQPGIQYPSAGGRLFGIGGMIEGWGFRFRRVMGSVHKLDYGRKFAGAASAPVVARGAEAGDCCGLAGAGVIGIGGGTAL
jgi:hypothetical protein